MNEPKLCESAYLTTSDPQKGPYLHAAAMIDRTGGTPHVYLVRGKCSDSVVTELHRQLIRAGRLPRSRSGRPGFAISHLLVLLAAAVAIGVLAALVGSSAR